MPLLMLTRHRELRSSHLQRYTRYSRGRRWDGGPEPASLGVVRPGARSSSEESEDKRALSKATLRPGCSVDISSPCPSSSVMNLLTAIYAESAEHGALKLE